MGTFKGYLTGHVGAVTGGDVTEQAPRRRRIGGRARRATAGAPRLISAAPPMSIAGRQFLDLDVVYRQRGVGETGRPGAAVRRRRRRHHADRWLRVAVRCRTSRTYDLGLSAGGGAFVALDDFAGFRADARYFFSVGRSSRARGVPTTSASGASRSARPSCGPSCRSPSQRLPRVESRRDRVVAHPTVARPSRGTADAASESTLESACQSQFVPESVRFPARIHWHRP